MARQKKKLVAKLRATLNPKTKNHGVTAPSAAGVSDVNTAANTANSLTFKPKIHKFSNKPSIHSNGSAFETNFQSQTSTKSTQPKHKHMLSKIKRKVQPTDKPNVTPNDNNHCEISQKNHNQPVEKDKKRGEMNKKKKPKPAVPVERELYENVSMIQRDKAKRKFEQSKMNDKIGTKRFKTEGNGFVVTDNTDDVRTKMVNEKSKKIKKKTLKTDKIDGSSRTMDAAAAAAAAAADDDDGPSVKVISVDENKSNGDLSLSQSDSEADSYIDKFFHDDNTEFNEDRIYSVDEIETENGDFLAKASGERTQSDDGTSSSEGIQVYLSDSNGSSSKMACRKRKKNHSNDDLAKYSWFGDDDSCENIGDSENEDDNDEDDGNQNGGMFYGSDSDVSLGSIVDSDDLDDTYECESSDESVDDYEMNSSYDSVVDESDGSSLYSYSEGESQRSSCSSSHDTYDEFLNSRHYDSSNDDQDYNDSRYDDVRIAHGTAVTYKIADKRIKIFENDTESRIIELPKTDSDDEKCVNLIPMNVSRTKLMKIERKKLIAKQAKLDEKKMKDEMARLAHEKAVSDYYNMDNSLNAPRNQHANDIVTCHSIIQSNNAVSIVKCPKSYKHLTLDWMVADDVGDQTPSDIVYPVCSKSKVINVTSVQDKKKVSKGMKKSKISIDKVEMGQIRSKAKEDEIPAVETETVVDVEKTADTDAAADRGCNKRRKLSSIQNKPIESQFFNSINSRHVLLLLRNELHFHGSLHVKLIAGKVIAFGYELQRNKTVTLHSPRGHGFINLISCPIGGETINQQQYLNALNSLAADFYSQDIEYLKNQMNCTSDAILLLERDQTNKGVNMIDRYMRETMFPNINAFNNDSPFYSSEFVLHCNFFTDADNGLVHNEHWSSINVRNTTKLVTIGGKGVGKSTFIRYLINSNIGKFPKFLFIDLDIGQPELFVPQTLSATVVTEPILGPGYLKNIKPSKAVLFGDINVLPNPIKYLRCVREIFEFCSSQNELSTIPWFINTMGYSRGFGSELIACILKIIQPSDVVQIQSRTYADNFEQIMNAETVNTFKFNVFEREMNDMRKDTNCQYKMHTFDAMRGKNSRKHMDMTAKDLRYTMILAKLGHCLKYNSDWLTSIKPLEASLNDLDVLITSGEEINPSDYLDLLNGNLVYLCCRQPDQTSDIIDCRGIGIVRSVDTHTEKLYLLSTIPLTEMQYVNVLAIGAIPLPSAVFLNQHMQVRGAVPYVYNSDNFVGSKQVAQHIFRAESKSSKKPIRLMED